MRKLQLAAATVSFLLAILVFVRADGARALYSGLFFVVIGAVMLINARRTTSE